MRFRAGAPAAAFPFARDALASDVLADGPDFEVHVLGERKKATVLSAPAIDPQGARMRA